jgi:hypothetical protein
MVTNPHVAQSAIRFRDEKAAGQPTMPKNRVPS